MSGPADAPRPPSGSNGLPDWDSDFEVALRLLRRRWWKTVLDLLEGSRGDHLAFDDLDLDLDLEQLEHAVSRAKLERLALRGLLVPAPESESDPGLVCLETTPPLARGFLRLLSANLAFALRTDTLAGALVAHVAGGATPRLTPKALGALLARIRSARDARALVNRGLAGEARDEALATIAPSARPGPFHVVHAAAGPEALAAALTRVLARRALAPVPWKTSAESTGATTAPLRFAVTRRRGGWATLLGESGQAGADGVVREPGVTRELALELSGTPPIVGARVLWVEREPATARFALFETRRLVDDEAQLAARTGSALEVDDVTGALRALGVTAHDEAAPGEAVPLVLEAAVGGGDGTTVKLRKSRVQALAFLPSAEAEKVERLRKSRPR